MQVFVTGAAGFLGSAACQALADAGHAVIGVDRRPTVAIGITWHTLDLRTPEAIYEPMAGCDAVIHLANHGGGADAPASLYVHNVTTNAHVFDAARALGIKQLIYASSVQVFAGDRHAGRPTAEKPSCLPYLPLDGQEPPCPGNAYAASKEAGEALLRCHARLAPDMAATAVRWPLLVDAKKLAFYRNRAPAERPVDGGMLDVGFSYLAVEDAATFLVALLERPRPGYRQWLPAAEHNRLGWPARRVHESFYPQAPLRQPLGEEPAALVDLEPIRAALDWRPRRSALMNNRTH